MIPRLLILASALSILTPMADAAPLSSGDLRRLGFTGNYRGDVQGNI